MLLQVEVGVDLLQARQHQPDPLVDRQRQQLQRVAHPGIGQADHAGPVGAEVEEIGAAGQPVAERHAHPVAAGGRVAILPERPVDHDEGLGRLHVARAVQRHPQGVGEQGFVGVDVGGEQPGLAGDQHGRVFAHVAPAVHDLEPARPGWPDAGDPGPRRPVVQPLERGTLRPVRHALGLTPPQPARQLLDAADDQPLVLVAVGDDDAQDLQHRVGEVRVPAAGAEADLAEHLAMAKRPAGEGTAGGDEIVEAAIVPDRHQRIPQRLEPRNVARADGVLDAAEARPSSSASRQASATSWNSGGS